MKCHFVGGPIVSIWQLDFFMYVCYPFELCYSKCRFSTDRIKQGLVFNVYYLRKIRCYLYRSIIRVLVFKAYQPFATAPNTYLYSNWNRSVTYFHWKILALARVPGPSQYQFDMLPIVIFWLGLDSLSVEIRFLMQLAGRK